jgi:hypothetical protein
MSDEEKIVQNENNSPQSENNQPVDNEEEFSTGDDKKEVNTDSKSDSSSSQDDDSNTEEVMALSLKDDSELFVLSVDGVPRFYTKTIDEARDKMWSYAKCRRIQETHYNTYIRGCPDKNRLEMMGSYKFSVFMVDRVICRLLVSAVQEFKTTTELKTVKETNEPPTPPTTPTTPTTPPVESPSKKSFFSSFFW